MDPNTVLFLDAVPNSWTMEDADSDGDDDMLFKFKIQELNFSLLVDEGDVYPYAYLFGETITGTQFLGKDTVNLV